MRIHALLLAVLFGLAGTSFGQGTGDGGDVGLVLAANAEDLEALESLLGQSGLGAIIQNALRSGGEVELTFARHETNGDEITFIGHVDIYATPTPSPNRYTYSYVWEVGSGDPGALKTKSSSVTPEAATGLYLKDLGSYCYLSLCLAVFPGNVSALLNGADFTDWTISDVSGVHTLTITATDEQTGQVTNTVTATSTESTECSFGSPVWLIL